jgi:Core-2/I-Branching enzyme
MSFVKIAYLILAHDNPAHLRRLTTALSSNNSSIFIHIDRKSDVNDFAGGADIHFSRERIPVYWGDFSQIEAALVLLRMAFADARHFDYFVLLSGADYPLQTAVNIECFFTRNAGDEFIGVEPMPSGLLHRLSIYRPCPSDHWLTRFPAKLARELGIKLRRDYEACLGELAPYYGSQWWALSRGACAYIQDFVAAKPRLFEFFKHTRCPDESLLHTILGNSRFKERIRASLTYTDWGRGGSSPALLTEKHIADLRSKSLALADRYREGDVLFARKFCDSSGGLVAEIDRLRMKGETAPADPA